MYSLIGDVYRGAISGVRVTARDGTSMSHSAVSCVVPKQFRVQELSTVFVCCQHAGAAGSVRRYLP
eukprot:9950992-Lingulodinium_polyedra.AAC.1